jgi:hypothetical protein
MVTSNRIQHPTLFLFNLRHLSVLTWNTFLSAMQAISGLSWDGAVSIAK